MDEGLMRESKVPQYKPSEEEEEKKQKMKKENV